MVGSHQLDQAVCLQSLIVSSAINRCVVEWLDIMKVVLMHFNHLMQTSIKFTLMVWLSCVVILVSIIWTYVAGYDVNTAQSDSCPCNTGSLQTAPPFVGNDYYCESGGTRCSGDILLNDPLWDGQQCDNLEAPCCVRSNMPWFIKTLSENTTEGIELRACQTNAACLGSVPISLIELYVR